MTLFGIYFGTQMIKLWNQHFSNFLSLSDCFNISQFGCRCIPTLVTWLMCWEFWHQNVFHVANITFHCKSSSKTFSSEPSVDDASERWERSTWAASDRTLALWLACSLGSVHDTWQFTARCLTNVETTSTAHYLAATCGVWMLVQRNYCCT